MGVDWSHYLVALLFAGFITLTLGMVILALGLFRRVSRRCAACGYDLKGLPPGTICPECGQNRVVDQGREIPRTHWQVWLGALTIGIVVVPLTLALLILVFAW